MHQTLVADPYTVATRYWTRLADGRVRCDVCPRYCKLRPGQRGACFVRGNLNDEIVLTTYGRSSGFCIDPIEKKPLNHFLPGTPVLSFGTAGCNLACKFCQNWDISKAREFDIMADQAAPESIAMAARAHGCRSVAFTYNDPIVFLEYARDVAAACHQHGLKTVAVTNNYLTAEARAGFYAHIDAVNVDLKSFSDEFYYRLTGARLQPVLDNLVWLVQETDVWLELTTLLIPGENDSDDELQRMCRWVVEHLGAEVPMHFSAFHPAFRMLDHPRTPAATLQRACTIAHAAGIRYAYTGNIADPETQSTHCHVCQQLLIGRSGYQITAWNLTRNGLCTHCHAPLPGVIEAEPGNWGARYRPVRIAAYA